MSAVNLKEFKTFFLSGKGGVGKSTLSAALAAALSRKGFKTLLVSLDPAHSLSPLFERKIGAEPTEVLPGLFCLEVDLEREMREYLKRVEREAEKLVSPAVIQQVKDQIELAYLSPGALELAALDAIYKIVSRESEQFDRLVFDTAPSGYTVRLTASTGKLVNWVNSLITLREEALKYRAMAGKREEEDPVVEALKRRREEYSFLGKLFKSPSTLFAVVVNPGKLPLEIGRRTVKELESAGVPVKAVFANRFKEEVKELFGKPAACFPPLDREPIGTKALEPLIEQFESLL
ncbi:Arsenite-transporting ATPase [Thermovibrio ammonificans HB-1]|uniref:arsenite-transporting ATPase n=1 Tax=Thermovibrio ammonificans (strain DSM 15698 / JCM 12110 / HB-1) TaxID=648996 RepID=E8T5Q8_THEA1|nr:TRC40/GET3/ArsA family transport-energizing ATPase [Thermovibrio ammonificans]ADU96533.1 Arsenite-transporting ATPase [Thermovibrio ammonificans HB-1]